MGKGINDTGHIVGYFIQGNRPHGFLDVGGTSRTIDVPGPLGTVAQGINDAGQIV